MKRIFVPTQTGADWQRLLAKPKLHWKAGASAMTAAAAWEAAFDSLPPEIATLLDSTEQPELMRQRLLVAIPEWQVQLPGGTTTSCTDVLALCHNDKGICVLGVEAKVLEDFGPLLAEKRSKTSAGQSERLEYLHNLLGVKHFEDSIRYQLLHRTASALLTGRDFHASSAVMLVHAFDTPTSQLSDFLAFVKAMDGIEVAPLVYRVKSFEQPSLYLAWCNGDPKFRQSQLPSALITSMDHIKRIFAERFANWDITLPAENIRLRSAGHIEKKGWLIQYCFGHDENGEYLDYYASHRMTDDEHIRLCADGCQIELGALGGLYLTSTDPIEANRLKEEHFESNRKITEELVTKGFDLFTINMQLQAGLADSEKK